MYYTKQIINNTLHISVNYGGRLALVHKKEHHSAKTFSLGKLRSHGAPAVNDSYLLKVCAPQKMLLSRKMSA